ncbi:hypothetical protein ACH5RR_029565 [Cinchona calisaya]|uniref:Uncharacterized protein n=1 Tax=Cinchona calisaya TaxID=153742 RepID=A0ABD2YS11_9GENT
MAGQSLGCDKTLEIETHPAIAIQESPCNTALVSRVDLKENWLGNGALSRDPDNLPNPNLKLNQLYNNEKGWQLLLVLGSFSAKEIQLITSFKLWLSDELDMIAW